MTKEEQEKDLDPNLSHAVAGILIYKPSKRWLDAGVKPGDFLGSTSATGDINSGEKIHAALKAPAGTELILVRNGERLKVIL